MNQSNPDDPHRRPAIGVGVVVLRRATSGPEVLLILKGKPPRRGQWSIPGGKQEWGEALQETAHREVMEETGVTISNLVLVDVIDGLFKDDTGSLAQHFTLVDYRATWVSGEVRAGDDAADVLWVPLTDLERYGLWSETLRVIQTAVASHFA